LNFLVFVTAEALQANIDRKSLLLPGIGLLYRKFYVEGDVSRQSFVHH